MEVLSAVLALVPEYGVALVFAAILGLGLWKIIPRLYEDFKTSMKERDDFMKDNIGTIVKSVSDNMAIVSDTMKSIDGRVAILDDKVDALDNKVNTMDIKVNRIQDDVTELRRN